MDFGKDCANKKYMFRGKEWKAENMLRLYIYNYMKKRGLHGVAEIFAQEANIEMFECVDSEEGMLKEWWQLFWPQFCSSMANKAQENPGSSAQPSMQNVLAMLASLRNPGVRSQQPPVGNPQQSVIPTSVINNQVATNQASDQVIGGGSSSVTNAVGQNVLQTPSASRKRRAGKRPKKTNTASILGLSAAQTSRKGPFRFPPVQLLPTQITPVSPSGNPSHLEMPVTLQPPPQVAKAPRNDVSRERSGQVESTYPAGQGSAYLPAAPNAGLSDS